MNGIKHISLNGNFQSIEDYNDTFKKVKIRVFAFDENRNNSDITRDAFQKAKNSLFNIPIVAKFTEEVDAHGNEGDLEGHNLELRIKDDEYYLYHDTYPIGVISANANISFEDVNEGTDENPQIKTYVVVDNIYLWRRYEATQKIEEWLKEGKIPKVSMEINNIEGSFNKETKVFVIDNFQFEAIAALGSYVEPCFPMATIQEYSKRIFKDNFYEMLNELKFSLQQESEKTIAEENNIFNFKQEGGQSMKEDNKKVEAEEIKETEVDDKQEFEIKEEQKEVPPTAEFALSHEQLENELKSLLYAEKEEDDWGYEYCKYYFVDYYTGEKNIVIVANWDSKLYGFPFSVDNDKVTIDTTIEQRYRIDYNPMDIPAESEIEEEKAENILTNDMVEYKVKVAKAQAEKSTKEEYEAKIVEFEAKIKKFEEDSEEMAKKAMETEEEMAAKEEELATEKVKNSSLETEITSMKSNQRTKDETLIYESFSSQLTEEEINSVKEKANELSLDEIKTQLFALVGQKTAQFSVIDRKNSKISVFNMDDKPKSSKEYAELIEQYRNK